MSPARDQSRARQRSPAPRVIHTGQALVDVVVDIPALPRRGGNVMARGFTRYAGGAVNVLVAAARTGAHAVHAGSHGTGVNGDLVRETFAREGVELSCGPLADVDTGICFVMIEPTAERTFVTTQGAERQITPQSLARSAPVAGDLVCVTGYSLLGPTREPLLTWLESLPEGVVVVFDPGASFAELDAAVQHRILALTDVWTSNAEEAAGLVAGSRARSRAGSRTGSRAGDESGPATPAAGQVGSSVSAVARLLPGDAVVIVRDGPRGCHLLERGHPAYLAGHPQHPVDTNGAGDAHTGVLVAERGLGADWVTAARRANAAGAIKVTRRGPATAPTRAEVDAFLAVHAH